MDANTHEQQQKDFLSSLFPPGMAVNQSDDPQMYNGSNPQAPMLAVNVNRDSALPSNNPNVSSQLNMDILGNLMAMQGLDVPSHVSHQQSQQQPTPQYSPQLLLEQQFKLTQLQQLQQLQNQIFQQQIALISGQSGVSVPESPTESQRDQHFHGLPTPGSSTELRPQPNTADYVSPMNLQFIDSPQHGFGNHMREPMNSQQQQQQQQQHLNAQYAHPHGSSSAPANIAFHTSPPLPLPSTADQDFDISPLTSPWLGAYHQSMAPRPVSNKRTASPSGDEDTGKPSRKRLSPAIRPSIPPSVSSAKKGVRGSKSASSTPLLRSSRSRRGSTAADGVGDTPSPVDLTMPPPAPPSVQNQLVMSPSTASASSPQQASSSTMDIPSSLHLTPVTPASMMNLGRLALNSSLSPPTPDRSMAKGKAIARTKMATDSTVKGKMGKRNAAVSLTSPSLKPILPAGNAPHNTGPPTPALPQPVLQVRKTSHKAAEQKRRDSLKTTFDDLRLLLPPIPLPSDDNYPDEMILPGALPPRGPPKAGGEGPNKGVSKLQLLMCGNDYIRQLKGRVARRDDEIEKLRREVARLRGLAGENAMGTVEEEIDLERDLDAVEALDKGLGLGRSGSVVADDEGEEEGD